MTIGEGACSTMPKQGLAKSGGCCADVRFAAISDVVLLTAHKSGIRMAPSFAEAEKDGPRERYRWSNWNSRLFKLSREIHLSGGK
jgi:hypothetical protein